MPQNTPQEGILPGPLELSLEFPRAGPEHQVVLPVPGDLVLCFEQIKKQRQRKITTHISCRSSSSQEREQHNIKFETPTLHHARLQQRRLVAENGLRRRELAQPIPRRSQGRMASSLFPRFSVVGWVPQQQQKVSGFGLQVFIFDPPRKRGEKVGGPFWTLIRSWFPCPRREGTDVVLVVFGHFRFLTRGGAGRLSDGRRHHCGGRRARRTRRRTTTSTSPRSRSGSRRSRCAHARPCG